ARGKGEGHQVYCGREFCRRRGRASACVTWSSSFEARARFAWRPLASLLLGCRSAADERTVALTEGTECLRGGDGGAHLVVVPWVLRLFGPLDLEQVHVVDLAPVGTDATGAEQGITGRQSLHLRDHGLAV